MYFWRIRNLVAVLTQRDLTESESFRYYFAGSLLVVVVLEISHGLPVTRWNAWDTIGAFSNIVIAIAGMIWCFKSNGGANGQSFLPRMVSLSWVVSIRFLVLAIVVMIFAYAIMVALGRISEETTLWDVVLYVWVEAAIFLRVAALLKRIRAARRELLEDLPS